MRITNAKKNNYGKEPTYASILLERSNTDIQKKLSKQKIAETNSNILLTQKLQTCRQNRRAYKKPRSAALSTSNTDEGN